MSPEVAKERGYEVTLDGVNAIVPCPICGARLRLNLNEIDTKYRVSVLCNCDEILFIPPTVWCSTCHNVLASGWQKLILTGSAREKAERQLGRPRLVMHNSGDPPIRVHPHTISHGFIVLTLDDIKDPRIVRLLDSDEGMDVIRQFSLGWQPDLTSQYRWVLKYGWFAAEAGDDGYPRLKAFPTGLEKSGVPRPYSVVTTTRIVMKGSLIEDHPEFKIWAGFTFYDDDPRLFYFTHHGGCVPA
jgi:hypothetical protein